MTELPIALPFDALHPVVVHFPIALLLVGPLLLGFGAFRGRAGATWQNAGLLLLALGTAALFVAVESGEASAARVFLPVGGEPLLLRHQTLGAALRWVFLGLTLGGAALLHLPPRLGRPLAPPVARGLLALLVIGSVFAGAVLLHTAHLGGRLVHELGVRAWAPPGP